MTKTKIALAAALFAVTSSAALAQGFDPNMANRYPPYANPGVSQPSSALRSAPVALQHRNVALPNNGGWAQTEINVDRADRASSPYAGGGY
jgi:hypothetical protein